MRVDEISRVQFAAPAGHSDADRLEEIFLEEMLKYCGPKPAAEGFGGGIGEDQFASFLTQDYAAALAARLDLGFGIWGAP